jgi:hypothetical protein
MTKGQEDGFVRSHKDRGHYAGYVVLSKTQVLVKQMCYDARRIYVLRFPSPGLGPVHVSGICDRWVEIAVLSPHSSCNPR